MSNYLSPKSIQEAIKQTRYCTFPMATRTSSARTVTMRAGGSTRITTSPTTGGIVRTASYSSPRNSLHFSPDFKGEFCFESWPCQPPSIFPASFKGIEMIMYFLSSKLPDSHKTISIIFMVSSFLTAILTYGSFSVFEKNVAEQTISIVSIKSLSILLPNEYFCVLGSFS